MATPRGALLELPGDHTKQRGTQQGPQTLARPTPTTGSEPGPDLGAAHRTRGHRYLPHDEAEPAPLVGTARSPRWPLGWRRRRRRTHLSGRTCSRRSRLWPDSLLARGSSPDLVGNAAGRTGIPARPDDLESRSAATATCPHTGSISFTCSPSAPISARYSASPTRTARMSSGEYSYPRLASSR